MDKGFVCWDTLNKVLNLRLMETRRLKNHKTRFNKNTKSTQEKTLNHFWQSQPRSFMCLLKIFQTHKLAQTQNKHLYLHMGTRGV